MNPKLREFISNQKNFFTQMKGVKTITIQDIARIDGCTWPTAKSYANLLRENGVIKNNALIGGNFYFLGICIYNEKIEYTLMNVFFKFVEPSFDKNCTIFCDNNLSSKFLCIHNLLQKLTASNIFIEAVGITMADGYVLDADWIKDSASEIYLSDFTNIFSYKELFSAIRFEDAAIIYLAEFADNFRLSKDMVYYDLRRRTMSVMINGTLIQKPSKFSFGTFPSKKDEQMRNSIIENLLLLEADAYSQYVRKNIVEIGNLFSEDITQLSEILKPEYLVIGGDCIKEKYMEDLWRNAPFMSQIGRSTRVHIDELPQKYASKGAAIYIGYLFFEWSFIW